MSQPLGLNLDEELWGTVVSEVTPGWRQSNPSVPRGLLECHKGDWQEPEGALGLPTAL